MRRLRPVIGVLVFAASVGAAGGVQPAVEISGTISSTLDLTGDAVLVGDVTCTVVGAPCIRISASGVALRLNGFSITGRADPVLGCGGGQTAAEHGIQVAGQRAVDIRGPGIVQQFRGHGIAIGGSSRVLVRQVTTSTNCFAGMILVGGGDHDLEANVAVRNGNNGFPCGGI